MAIFLALVEDYRDEAPQILCDFLSYHESIKAHSQKTVDEYFLDLLAADLLQFLPLGVNLDVQLLKMIQRRHLTNSGFLDSSQNVPASARPAPDEWT